MKLSIDEYTIESKTLPAAISGTMPKVIEFTERKTVKKPVLCDYCMMREVQSYGETCLVCLSLGLSKWNRVDGVFSALWHTVMASLKGK